MKPGSPLEKSIVSLISVGLKLELAAGDPAGGLTVGNEEMYFSKKINFDRSHRVFVEPFDL